MGANLLVHIVLARIWSQENGYEWPIPKSSMETVYDGTAELIGYDALVDDLKLEAATFLYLAG